MPVRALNDLGITGIWTALLLAIAGLVASLPFLLIAPESFGKIGWPHILGALGIGSAFTLYGIALSFTDIIRVVLLFYLAPAWSIIIECVFFHRKFTIRSFLGLLLSFIGIVVIFRGELPVCRARLVYWVCVDVFIEKNQRYRHDNGKFYWRICCCRHLRYLAWRDKPG